MEWHAEVATCPDRSSLSARIARVWSGIPACRERLGGGEGGVPLLGGGVENNGLGWLGFCRPQPNSGWPKKLRDTTLAGCTEGADTLRAQTGGDTTEIATGASAETGSSVTVAGVEVAPPVLLAAPPKPVMEFELSTKRASYRLSTRRSSRRRAGSSSIITAVGRFSRQTFATSCAESCEMCIDPMTKRLSPCSFRGTRRQDMGRLWQLKLDFGPKRWWR